MLKYKGYSGRVEYDDEVNIFHGEVIDGIEYPWDSAEAVSSNRIVYIIALDLIRF